MGWLGNEVTGDMLVMLQSVCFCNGVCDQIWCVLRCTDVAS